MYQLKFTLKQHTPIIHFQHDQDGATLRATEVKPKLDKFMWNKWILEEGGMQEAFERYAEYLSGYNEGKRNEIRNKFFEGYRALNFKVQVTTNTPKIRSEHRIISEWEKGVMNNDLQIRFTMHFSTLKDAINGSLKDFFIIHNFGKRQNKGYGCFYLNGTMIGDIINVLQKYSSSCVFESQVGDSFENTINTAWRRLKSGQNRPYEKSRVFRYASKNKMSWEKRYMKLELIDMIAASEGILPDLQYTREPLDCSANEETKTYNGLADNPDLTISDPNDYAYFFLRCFLGLPELYEFRTVSRAIYQYKISSDFAERFKAPVTFKVFENKVFAFAEAFTNAMLDVVFEFELFIKDPQSRSLNKTLDLRTPADFDIRKFLIDYFPTVGFKKIN